MGPCINTAQLLGVNKVFYVQDKITTPNILLLILLSSSLSTSNTKILIVEFSGKNKSLLPSYPVSLRHFITSVVL
jgi:hypothetical protein